jgi:uncharacterized membrane protein
MSTDEENAVQTNREPIGSSRLLILFLIGFSMAIAGMLLLIIATMLYGTNSPDFGGVIFIGPIPIVVGIGSDPIWTVLLALVLSILGIVLFLVLRRKMLTETEEASDQVYP